MADIYWPSGVGDDPLRDGLQWGFRENGEAATTDSGHARVAPRYSSCDVEMTAGYPMSYWQYHGLWLPWWQASPSQGGCLNGMVAFWLRDPHVRQPRQWLRQHGQAIRPERDGVGFIVWLQLLGIAS